MARRERAAVRRCFFLDGGAVSVIGGRGVCGEGGGNSEYAPAPGVRGVADACSGDIGGVDCGVA
jgi:hypothetical protein